MILKLNLIGQQSSEINGGVEQDDGIIGAGDQGFMVGYATNKNTKLLTIKVFILPKQFVIILKWETNMDQMLKHK